MKQLFRFWIVTALLLVVGCSKEYDDSAIRADIDRLEDRLSDVERLLNALEERLTITSAQETPNGCEITFSDGSTIVVTNGRDGQDGQDGQDGKDGANGKDGADGENGKDGADGETLIESVTIGQEVVTFVLTDGRIVEIPLSPKVLPLSIVIDAPLPMGVELGAEIILDYVVQTQEAAENVLVEVFSDGDVRAKLVVDEQNPAAGKIHISIGAALDDYSKVVILATDGVSATMKTLTFEEGYMASYAHGGSRVPSDGYLIEEVYFFSNMPYEVIIPEDAQDWISVESTRSQMERCVSLRVENNYGSYRMAEITIKAIGSDLFLTTTIVQEAHPDVAVVEEAELRTVLVRLYEEMGGENWFTDWEGNPTDGNWCSDKSIYEWRGVSRSFNDDFGMITKVDLGGWGDSQEIKGSFPEGVFRGAKNVIFDFGWNSNLVGELNAEHLEGVENFGIALYGTGITKVNVADTKGLIQLRVPEECEELNVSGCVNLDKYEGFFGIPRGVVKLDISELPFIEDVSYMDKLQSLTARNCVGLTGISLSGYTNKLSHLDLEGCTSLSWVSLDGTSLPLTDIDLSKYGQLEYFSMTNSPNLKSVSCANHPTLTNLWLNYNSALSSVDVSGCDKLQYLGVEGTAITSLDVSGLEALESVAFPKETIEHFNAEGCTSFLGSGYGELTFGLPKGALKSLNIDNCTSLTRVDINYASREFTQFAPKGCTALTYVWVNGCDHITYLDLSECLVLENAYIHNCGNLKCYYVPDGCYASSTNAYAIERAYKDYVSSDFSADGSVRIIQTATEGNGIDVVIMLDGLVDKDVASGYYDNTTNYIAEQLFAWEPFKSFRHLFNVYAVTAVSEEYCLDTALGVKKSLSGEYKYGEETIRTYAMKAISSDRMANAVVICATPWVGLRANCVLFESNSKTDYGEGLGVARVGFRDIGFLETLQHEVCGHGFAKLLDEYIEDGEGKTYTGGVEYESKGWGKNVSVDGNPTTVKWAHFIADERYASEGIGVFEGALYFSYGAYRATENSVMRSEGQFNAPSREAIYYRIHKLAYGADWEYDYEEFVAWDERNRTAIAEMSPMSRVPYRTHDSQLSKRTSSPIIIPYGK